MFAGFVVDWRRTHHDCTNLWCAALERMFREARLPAFVSVLTAQPLTLHTILKKHYRASSASFSHRNQLVIVFTVSDLAVM